MTPSEDDACQSGSPSTNKSHAEVSATTAGGREWGPLTRIDWLVIGLTVALIGAVTVPRLPPGICYGDAGDLQAACALGGIAHPPGYPVLVSMGWVLTRLPGIEPAYMISLACLACGIAALAVGTVMQIRLGVPAGLAGAATLVVAGHPRVWQNLLAPEVYAPSLLFYAGGVYLLWRHARVGKVSDLVWGSLLWGLAVASRPATVLLAPFLVIAFYFGTRQHGMTWGPALRRLGLAVALAAVPTIYSLAFLWVRDTPDTAYNYIEQYNAEAQAFQDADQGPHAKFERMVWQARGAQFANMMGNTWRGVRTRFRWLAGEMELDTRPPRWAAAALVVLAWGLGISRCKMAGCLLMGMMVQNMGFICAYRVSGQAANILPMLWAGGLLAGVAVSIMLPKQRSKWRAMVSVAVLAAAGVWTVLDHRVAHGKIRDAVDYVEQADLATLPANAVIWSDWGTSPPLWYARAVSTKRTDIAVVNASPGGWPRMIAAYMDRPIFYINEFAKTPEGYALVRYRNLWKLVPDTSGGQ